MRRIVFRSLAAAAVGLIVAGTPASARAATPLAPTPYMGWSPYYSGEGSSNEATFEGIAQSLISTGLQAAGYKIFWLDYGWANGGRDSNGNLIISSSQWPDGMLGFTTWLHSHGFLAGIYTDAGTSGCSSSGVGSYGHYASGSTNPYSQDVDQFAAWGFDAVKVDFCGAGQQWQDQPPHDPRSLYALFSQAVAGTGRPMIINVCNFWDPHAINGTVPSLADSSWDTYSWAPSIAQSWRTDTDIGFPKDVVFSNVLRNLRQDSTSQTTLQTTPTIQNAAGPPGSSGIASGHWNDPDNLAPGLSMTDTQAQSQFSLWAMVAAPLMLGSDPRNLTQTEINMLQNPNVLAVDQDSLGAQGYLLSGQGTTAQVWVKPLANGDRAVALLNTGTSSQQISTTASADGLAPASGYHLDDLWTNATTTTDAGGDITAQVPPDGVTLYRVSPADPERLSVSLAGDGFGTVNDDSGAIACPGTCSSVYGQGRLVTLTASASPGSAFAGWSGGGCSGTGTCTVSLQSDAAVTAAFVPLRTLTVSVIGAGAGTITAPGISCPGSCSASYPEGASVTLRATPGSRSQFGAWLGGGCAAFASSCTVTMSADASVTAAFDLPRSGTAYVVDGRRSDVVPIDLATDTSAPPIHGFDAPRQIAISPDGGTAYVVNAGNATVTPINLATNATERPIRGFQRPGPIAISADGTTGYVLEDGRMLVPIDLTTNRREPVISLSNRSALGEHAASLALARNGKTAYIGTFNARAGSATGTLAVVDLRSGRVKAVIHGFARPAAIAVAPNGTTAYVADAARGNVTAVNLATARVIAPPTLTAPDAFPGADAVALTPDGTSLYVADARGVTPVDLPTRTERSLLTGLSTPSAIAIANPPAPNYSAKLWARLTVNASTVTDMVTCVAPALSCTTTQTLTVIRVRGRPVVPIVGRTTVTIAARRTVRVKLGLNAAGRRLASQLGSLPVILTVAIRRHGHADTLATRQLVLTA